MARRIHVRRRANHAHLVADLIGVGALAVLAGAAYLFGLLSPAFAVIAGTVVIVALGAKSAYRHTGNRWASGARGEDAVARRLRGLRRRGWAAVHDINVGRGNIDHVAVGPGGVVAIETKNHARLDRVTPRMYAQAKRNARRVSEATGVAADPVIVLTRARIRPRDRRSDEGVAVVDLNGLIRALKRRAPVLREADVERIRGRAAGMDVPREPA